MSDERDKHGLSLVPDCEMTEGTIVRSRAEAAIELRQAGKSNAEIAKLLGFNQPSDVQKAINKQMEREAAHLTTEDRESILSLMLGRLDKMHEALWPSALYGDPKAVDAVLKIMDRYMKWTGVDQPDSSTGQNNVLVIAGDTDRYVERLKQLADPHSATRDDDEEEE